jgi:AcrR family transcriptional regulator
VPHYDRRARQAMLLQAAVEVAQRDGLARLTHESVAAACSPPCHARTVYRWAGTREGLRLQVVRYARACGLVKLLAEARALRL